MKRVLLAVFVAGLMTASANAYTIGMTWEGHSPDQMLPAYNSDYIVIETWVHVHDGENLATVFFGNASAPGVYQVDTSPELPGWVDNSTDGELGDTGVGQQALWGAPGGVGSVDGPGDFLVGIQIIHFEGFEESDIIEIYFDIATMGVIAADSSEPSWDARYASSYSGYIMFVDFGNPGWGTNPAKGHQPTANPLLIHVTPEPSTLALLALGGLGILRRR